MIVIISTIFVIVPLASLLLSLVFEKNNNEEAIGSDDVREGKELVFVGQNDGRDSMARPAGSIGGSTAKERCCC